MLYKISVDDGQQTVKEFKENISDIQISSTKHICVTLITSVWNELDNEEKSVNSSIFSYQKGDFGDVFFYSNKISLNDEQEMNFMYDIKSIHTCSNGFFIFTDTNCGFVSINNIYTKTKGWIKQCLDINHNQFPYDHITIKNSGKTVLPHGSKYVNYTADCIQPDLWLGDDIVCENTILATDITKLCSFLHNTSLPVYYFKYDNTIYACSIAVDTVSNIYYWDTNEWVKFTTKQEELLQNISAQIEALSGNYVHLSEQVTSIEGTL